MLNAKLQGHYQYYGINDNWPSLMRFREAAIRMTKRWLRRRSQKTFVSWQDLSVACCIIPRAPQATNLIA